MIGERHPRVLAKATNGDTFGVQSHCLFRPDTFVWVHRTEQLLLESFEMIWRVVGTSHFDLEGTW